MGLFDKLKNVFGTKEVPEDKVLPKPKKTTKVRKPKAIVPELSAKEKATQAGEPYINILSLDIDPNDINSGAFDLDFNEIFVARLVKAGYMMNKDDKDTDIVDRWFQQVCRNVVLELYDQVQADPMNRDIRPIQSRDLGNGRTEVS
jgi:hypothetical protein